MCTVSLFFVVRWYVYVCMMSVYSFHLLSPKYVHMYDIHVQFLFIYRRALVPISQDFPSLSKGIHEFNLVFFKKVHVFTPKQNFCAGLCGPNSGGAVNLGYFSLLRGFMGRWGCSMEYSGTAEIRLSFLSLRCEECEDFFCNQLSLQRHINNTVSFKYRASQKKYDFKADESSIIFGWTWEKYIFFEMGIPYFSVLMQLNSILGEDFATEKEGAFANLKVIISRVIKYILISDRTWLHRDIKKESPSTCERYYKYLQPNS